jgi:hypothetical protein
MTWLRQILLASAVVAQTASVNPHRQEQPVLLEEGDFVSESELARELPADKDHPLTRKLRKEKSAVSLHLRKSLSPIIERNRQHNSA